MIIKVDHVIRQLDSYLSGKNEEGKKTNLHFSSLGAGGRGQLSSLVRAGLTMAVQENFNFRGTIAIAISHQHLNTLTFVCITFLRGNY
jgi:hypothetical protein